MQGPIPVYEKPYTIAEHYDVTEQVSVEGTAIMH